jgi:hypothetical protein
MKRVQGIAGAVNLLENAAQTLQHTSPEEFKQVQGAIQTLHASATAKGESTTPGEVPPVVPENYIEDNTPWNPDGKRCATCCTGPATANVDSKEYTDSAGVTKSCLTGNEEGAAGQAATDQTCEEFCGDARKQESTKLADMQTEKKGPLKQEATPEPPAPVDGVLTQATNSEPTLVSASGQEDAAVEDMTLPRWSDENPAPTDDEGRCKDCCLSPSLANADTITYGAEKSCLTGRKPKPFGAEGKLHHQAMTDVKCMMHCGPDRAKHLVEGGKTEITGDKLAAEASGEAGKKATNDPKINLEAETESDTEKLQDQTVAFSRSMGGKWADKIKEGLKQGAALTSTLIGSVFSHKIAWAFVQAFTQDDELTNDGNSDFMRHGVSVAAMAGFFASAISHASKGLAGGGADGNFDDSYTAAMEAMSPGAASAEASKKAAEMAPVSFKATQELVLEGRGSVVLQKRACLHTEVKAKEKACELPSSGRYWGVSECAEDQCEVGMPVLAPATAITFQSWTRAEFTLSIPPVKVFPTMGLEIEFDLTPLLYAGVNAQRTINHENRVKRCELCVASNMGFCDRKWKSTDYHPTDDVCQEVVRENREDCETSGAPGGADDFQSPRFIDSEQGCNEMTYPKQTEQTHATFYGNELRVGGK